MLANLREDAEVLRLGLRAGVLATEDVVRWADRVIAEQPTAAGPFFDLAVATPTLGAARLSALLGDVPGRAEAASVSRRFLGLLLAWYDREPTAGLRIARMLGDMAEGGMLSAEQFGWEPYSLDELFTEPFCTPDEAARELPAYLEAHSSAPAV